MALGVLLGLAAWLLTGEPGPGALVALVVAVAAGIISATRPTAGTGPYYQLGAFVLVVLFLMMKFGGGRGGPQAWHELEPQYITDRRPPGLERQPQVHLIRRTSKFSIKPYRYRRVFVALGRDGIDLRPSWPQTLVYRSLHIPLRRLAGCRNDQYMFAGHALLEVQYPMVEVGLPDTDGRVLAWCRDNGVGGKEAPSEDARSSSALVPF
jgi:hypothetical protein